MVKDKKEIKHSNWKLFVSIFAIIIITFLSVKYSDNKKEVQVLNQENQISGNPVIQSSWKVTAETVGKRGDTFLLICAFEYCNNRHVYGSITKFMTIAQDNGYRFNPLFRPKFDGEKYRDSDLADELIVEPWENYFISIADNLVDPLNKVLYISAHGYGDAYGIASGWKKPVMDPNWASDEQWLQQFNLFIDELTNTLKDENGRFVRRLRELGFVNSMDSYIITVTDPLGLKGVALSKFFFDEIKRYRENLNKPISLCFSAACSALEVCPSSGQTFGFALGCTPLSSSSGNAFQIFFSRLAGEEGVQFRTTDAAFNKGSFSAPLSRLKPNGVSNWVVSPAPAVLPDFTRLDNNQKVVQCVQATYSVTVPFDSKVDKSRFSLDDVQVHGGLTKGSFEWLPGSDVYTVKITGTYTSPGWLVIKEMFGINSRNDDNWLNGNSNPGPFNLFGLYENKLLMLSDQQDWAVFEVKCPRNVGGIDGSGVIIEDPSIDPPIILVPPACGNGIREIGEQCGEPGLSCIADAYVNDGELCTDSCNQCICVPHCEPLIPPPEQVLLP